MRWIPLSCTGIYPPVAEADSSVNPEMVRDGTPDSLAGTEVLRREVELLRERLTDKSAVIDDLRQRLDQSEQERRDKDPQLTALLTDQRQQQAERAPAPQPREGLPGLAAPDKGLKHEGPDDDAGTFWAMPIYKTVLYPPFKV
jgi:hypothetical protein